MPTKTPGDVHLDHTHNVLTVHGHSVQLPLGSTMRIEADSQHGVVATVTIPASSIGQTGHR